MQDSDLAFVRRELSETYWQDIPDDQDTIWMIAQGTPRRSISTLDVPSNMCPVVPSVPQHVLGSV